MERNFFGRNVSKPNIRTRSRRGTGEPPVNQTYAYSSENARIRTDDPQYSLKYLGISNGEIGILSRRQAIARSTTRQPRSGSLSRPQRYRLDPNTTSARDQARPFTAPSSSGSRVYEDEGNRPSSDWDFAQDSAKVEEETQPRPDLYDQWLIQSIPPRPALSAGRRRADIDFSDLGEYMSDVKPNIGGIGGIAEAGGGRRPGSAPAGTRRRDIRGRRRGDFVQRPKTAIGSAPSPKLMQGSDTTGGELPFCVHNRVRGWKLTGPQTRWPKLSLALRKSNVSLNEADGFSEEGSRRSLEAQAQIPVRRRARSGRSSKSRGSRSDARVTMRQTGAVIDTFERLQRGQAKRSQFRSGHHWSNPHPVVDVTDRDIRAQSATAATHARRVVTNNRGGSEAMVRSVVGRLMQHDGEDAESTDPTSMMAEVALEHEPAEELFLSYIREKNKEANSSS